MLKIRPASQFKKDMKKAKKQGRDLQALKHVLELLAEEEPCRRVLKITGSGETGRISVNATLNRTGS